MTEQIDQDIWNPAILSSHPIYWPLTPSANDFVSVFSQWPQLSDYQNHLDQAYIQTDSGQALTVVEQSYQQESFDDHYEPRIYLKGELQTRKNNWHDFFQILIWHLFPKTKSRINQLHVHAIESRLKNKENKNKRSVLENTLTQFDECGAVIISPDKDLLQLIKNFQWKTLFWDKRKHVEKNLKCIVFGHAVYEKSLNPYIGMTAHAVLMHTPQNMFQLSTTKLLSDVDRKLESIFAAENTILTPQDLSPFPLLGYPGWHSDNNTETFYNDSQYFRPGRKKKC